MPKPSTGVRALPYPTLEAGNFSFPNGSYVVKSQQEGTAGNEVRLKHEISGAAFVENLIQEGRAKCGCLVSVSKTGYRKMENGTEDNKYEQVVSWDLSIAGEPPLIGPVIILNEDVEHQFSEEDGVAEIWQGKTIKISRGARLARTQYLRPTATMHHLLKVKKAENMEEGRFKVEPNTNDGFSFSVVAAPDVYDFLQNPQGHDKLKHSMLIHAVSRCFNILQNEYGSNSDSGEEGDEIWAEYFNLRALSDWLNNQGLSHWCDDGFDPMETATKLYPAKIPKPGE